MRPALLLAVAFLTFAVAPMQACDCLASQGLLEDVERSDAVFVGRVINLKLVTQHDQDATLVTFSIRRAWKGAVQETIEVITSGTQSPSVMHTCAVSFALGDEYVVFAGGETLSTSSCTRTAPSKGAESLVRELDRLVSGGI